jgi:AmiR/NasT family two-component response regulator
VVELADTVDSKSTARKGIAVQVRSGVPIQERFMLQILIAEDEALIRLDLAESLSSLGFDVVATVGNGEEAVAAALKLNPQIVLLDIKMPVMDGLSAAEILVKKGFCCILITAFSSVEIVNRATEIGVDGYIVKPWRLDSLKPAIEIGFAQHQRRLKLIDLINEQVKNLEDHKIIDRARALIISKYNLSESEAFKIMQRAAMDGRRSMTEVAKSIIEQA